MARPDRIILLRHGESEANLDDSLYERVPDHSMELSERGRAQAIAAGATVRELIGDGGVCVYVSPYLRTQQTLELLALGDRVWHSYEEPRLREQDWANLQDQASIEAEKVARNHFGHFFYRFHDGESGADVYDRVSGMLETLHRDFDSPAYPRTALLVTHGLTMRLFCMRWFHWSVAEFEALSNPDNAAIRVLSRGADNRYTLDQPFDRWR